MVLHDVTLPPASVEPPIHQSSPTEIAYYQQREAHNRVIGRTAERIVALNKIQTSPLGRVMGRLAASSLNIPGKAMAQRASHWYDNKLESANTDFNTAVAEKQIFVNEYRSFHEQQAASTNNDIPA